MERKETIKGLEQWKALLNHSSLAKNARPSQLRFCRLSKGEGEWVCLDSWAISGLLYIGIRQVECFQGYKAGELVHGDLELAENSNYSLGHLPTTW
jgi:hypothetical protein